MLTTIDTARVIRPPFVHFMGLTLRYDYSRGYCVLLPSTGFGRVARVTRDDRLT